jgi:hypothetical protein
MQDSITLSQPQDYKYLPPKPPDLKRSTTFPPFCALESRAERVQKIWEDYDIALHFDLIIGGVHYLFFVGRTNPPHAGHIANIKSLIRSGLDKLNGGNSVKVFLLLGDGPANDRESNPIDFSLKRQIIFNHIFKSELIATSSSAVDDRFSQDQLNSINFQIFQNKNPCGLIREIIREFLLEQKINTKDISQASATLFVGDKGDDSVKLKPLLDSASGELSHLLRDETTINVTTQVLEPIQSTTDIPLSSTIIRKVANTALSKPEEEQINYFNTNTGNFYTTEEAEQILSQINTVMQGIAAKQAAKDEKEAAKKAAALEKEAAKTKRPSTANRSKRLDTISGVKSKGGRTKKRNQRKSKRHSQRNKRRSKKR